MVGTFSSKANSLEWLVLPPVERTALYDAYGATAVAAEYCGFKEVPRFTRGHWTHGWVPSHWRLVHPDMVMGETTSPHATYWVARKDEEEYLRHHGYAHVE